MTESIQKVFFCPCGTGLFFFLGHSCLCESGASVREVVRGERCGAVPREQGWRGVEERRRVVLCVDLRWGAGRRVQTSISWCHARDDLLGMRVVNGCTCSVVPYVYSCAEAARREAKGTLRLSKENEVGKVGLVWPAGEPRKSKNVPSPSRRPPAI